MPPGAKKRRAAKKKKENQSNNHWNPSSVSAHSNGDEDVKHHDEKDGDVGEVSSPVSQDHHNPLTLTEGEDEEIGKKKNGLRINASVVRVEREFEIEDKSGRVEYDEVADPFSVEQLKVEPLLLEKYEKKPSYVVEDKVGTPLEREKDAIVQSVEKTATILDQKPLLVPSPPCPEKTTSWKSCCGLFEVFSGSGR